MNKNKEKALALIKQKNNGEIIFSYNDISLETGYCKRQLIRFSKEIEKRDIDSILVHGLTNIKSNNSASDKEIEYIKNFKKKYPVITISQFQDIYNEDVIFNKKMKSVIKEHGLRLRSESFFQQLFKKEGWSSPIKHKYFDNKKHLHPLRDPMPRRGMLIMTDGTPHDWFQNGNNFSLHLTLDDATGEPLSGWFMPTECQFGYCMAFRIMFEKYGLPESIYSDRTTILWNKAEDKPTQVARMLDELGIELIYANSAEAKGKIEKMNFTIQNRLLNDIKRFKIKTYSELNKWFNDFYIDYLRKKFAYCPKEEESNFIPLDNINLKDYMFLKCERKILNGNMISYNNNYYIPVENGEDFIFYKGTLVEVREDVFDNEITIYKNNKRYKTRRVEGHRIDPIKRKQKRIDDQKMLVQLFKERDERIKNKNKI